MKARSTTPILDAEPGRERGNGWESGAKFTQVRRTTQALCSELTAEDCMVQSMADASPVKWHLAHTTWFFETFVLTPHLADYTPLNPEYRNLFNSYYNAVGDRPLRDKRGVFSRPSLDEVYAFRRHVDDAMLKLLQDGVSAEIAELVVLGMQHEQQHQELIITDMKNGLWSNSLRPAFCEGQTSAQSEPLNPAVPRLKWHSYQVGNVEIGHDGKGFSFDNETPRHKVYLQDFQLASRLITNAEYMQFMLDDGYRRSEIWLSEGWETVRTQGWDAPLYWERRGDHWWNYTCAGMRPVELSEPVCHVSFFEADAFARWAEARLPTEAEWEVAAAEIGIEGNFLESGTFHPVATSEDGAKLKPQQMFGDVWEWTQSAYSAYPGFKPAAGALGEYNGKFMCNQYVLRGGSCATPQSHIRATYRNFFPAHARWQFSGIRLAKD
jgi:ergothioneine biosynthesis protein EgtB